MLFNVEVDKLRQSSLPTDLSHLPLQRRRDGDGDSRTPPSTIRLPNSRPIPPTPHRMAALNGLMRNDPISYPVPVRVSSRPSSITSIPCPVSGTTRQATPTKFCASTFSDQTCTVEPLLSPTYARRSAHIVDKPPTSFRQHSMLLSQSLDPEYSKKDSTRRLNRELANHRFANSVSSDGAPIQTAPGRDNNLHSSVAIPKSTTSNSSASHTRNITPHRLMQPIHPPLPRSHTLTNVSCFASQALLTPTRSSRQVSFSRRFDRIESSKTFDLKTPNRNQSSDGTAHSSPQTIVHALSTDITQAAARVPAYATSHTMSPNLAEESHDQYKTEDTTINLSINDVANNSRLEHQRQEVPQAKPLFVNSTLSNSLGENTNSDSSIPKTAADYSVESISDTAHSDHDIREVYTAEDHAYWTGRFVTTCDRLRQADCTALSNGDENTKLLSINSTAFEESYNRLETTRMTRALQILNTHCRTKAALKSLTDFEAHLLQVPKPIPTFPRSASDNFWKQNSMTRTRLLSGGFRPDDLANFKGSSRSCSTSTSSVSAVNIQATFGKLANMVGRTGLVKSKTTSNIAKLPARVITRSTSKAGAGKSDPSNRTRRTHDHTRKLSNLSISFTSSSETASTASTRNVRQESRVVQSMNGITHRDHNTGHNTGEMNVRHSSRGTREKTVCTAPVKVPVSAVSHIGDILDSDKPADCNLTALPVEKDRMKQYVTEITNTQKTPRSVTRMARSGSGEIIKKMVDASTREVRKISRRVGSMGWGNSHEDLTVSGKR